MARRRLSPEEQAAWQQLARSVNPLAGARTATQVGADIAATDRQDPLEGRSEEHTSELQSLMRISYAVFCLKKKNTLRTQTKAISKDTPTKKHTANFTYSKK